MIRRRTQTGYNSIVHINLNEKDMNILKIYAKRMDMSITQLVNYMFQKSIENLEDKCSKVKF